MTKRRADMTEEERTRVNERARDLMRRRRALMSQAQKDEARIRAREGNKRPTHRSHHIPEVQANQPAARPSDPPTSSRNFSDAADFLRQTFGALDQPGSSLSGRGSPILPTAPEPQPQEHHEGDNFHNGADFLRQLLDSPDQGGPSLSSDRSNGAPPSPDAPPQGEEEGDGFLTGAAFLEGMLGTDQPDSEPSHAGSHSRSARPPRPSSPQVDLLTDVLGVQVDARAEVVTWSSGQVSALPTVLIETKSGVVNFLKNDAEYVRDLSTIPKSLPSSKFVRYLDRKSNSKDLLETARRALADNQTVVVRGLVDVGDFKFDETGLYEEFSCFPDRKIFAHDIKQRVVNFSRPGRQLTISQFMREINDANEIKVALDFPLSQLAVPQPFEKLDDGLCIGWTQTHRTASVDHSLIPGDIWTMRSWGIAHHAGVLTYPHHDAEGAITFIIPMSGVKNWVSIFPKDSRYERKDLVELTQVLSNPDAVLTHSSDKFHFETIDLNAGDFLLMPPGQMHSVFTPVAGFCRGGNLFNLDCMHLTELSRFVDHKCGKFVTNHAHKGTLEVLCRLVLALPIVSSRRKLYKRSLIALCGMVAYSTLYTAQEEQRQQSVTLQQATPIAKKILEHFSLKTGQQYREFLHNPNGYLFSKGEEVEVFGLLANFR